MSTLYTTITYRGVAIDVTIDERATCADTRYSVHGTSATYATLNEVQAHIDSLRERHAARQRALRGDTPDLESLLEVQS